METKDPAQKRANNQIANLARFSAMGFQMLAIIGLGAFGGIKIDKQLSWKFPVFTLILTILGVIIALYYFIRDASRLADKHKPRK